MPFTPWVPTIGSLAPPLSVANGGTGGTSTATALANLGLAGPANYPIPADFGQIAWSNDPATASVNTALTNNTITLIAVILRTTATITNIVANVGVAGATLTAAENFAGLYDSTGTQRGVTADQTTPWGSTGVKIMALTSSFAAPAGFYYVAFLSNGTTPPSFRCSTNVAALANTNTAASTLRYATNGTGTTLPGSLTLASNSSANVTPIAVVLT